MAIFISFEKIRYWHIHTALSVCSNICSENNLRYRHKFKVIEYCAFRKNLMYEFDAEILIVFEINF